MGEEPRTTRGEGGLPFRPDIQGMRAIAVLLVALQHAGVPHITGGYVGVDVFFVVSGFLITGLLLRRADATGSVGIGRFYAARAKRILPAATLTLVVVCVAAVAWLNYVRATQILHDAMWCAAFAANIHFAQVGSDYFAQGSPPSPPQWRGCRSP
jgi:peptidoglycan/LPS O-acetylase OafA/YrhL